MEWVKFEVDLPRLQLPEYAIVKTLRDSYSEADPLRKDDLLLIENRPCVVKSSKAVNSYEDEAVLKFLDPREDDEEVLHGGTRVSRARGRSLARNLARPLEHIRVVQVQRVEVTERACLACERAGVTGGEKGGGWLSERL